jgi:hypothetical protein
MTINQTGGDLVLIWTNGRCDGAGVINMVEGGYIIVGYMNFPDDINSPYILNFHVANKKIYWDGLMGSTGNIWTRSTALDCT